MRSAAAPTELLAIGGTADPVATGHGLLRAVASAAELEAAALAELIRVPPQ